MNAVIHADSAGLLKDAIALTASMLAAASRGDWESVVEMERDRAPLIGHSGMLSEEIGTLLGELRELNLELERLTGEARLAAALSANIARLKKVAIDTYGDAGKG